MNFTEKKAVRVAILDMNEGKPNQGMRCIREILNQFGDASTSSRCVRMKNMRNDSYVLTSKRAPPSPLS